MSDASLHPPSRSYASAHDAPGFFSRAERWLDERGKGAWIAAMVLGFIFAWPVGLALLAYMIWSKRMFSRSCAQSGTHVRRAHFRAAFKSSGNTAFDAYKSDTLRRLEEEQRSFEEFLERLREAKDKSEFDQFMNDRAARSASAPEADIDSDDDAAAEPK